MRSRVMAPLSVVLLAVLAAGCSSDDEPDSRPTEITTSADETAATATTDAPTEASSSTVAAATGEQVQLENTVKLRVPEQYRWLVDDAGDEILATATTPQGLVDIGAGDILNDSDSIDEMADIVLEGLEDGASKNTRLADRTVAGVEGFVLESLGEERQLLHFGTLHNGRLVRITVSSPPEFGTEAAGEIFAAVLASVEWK